ncbi:MAG: phosphate acyltransferase PlsX [Myxococcota bacterium]
MAALQSDHPITLAIDAMGGYNAPDQIVEAIARASAELSRGGGTRPVFFTLVGDERVVASALSARSHNPERINVVHSPFMVGMGESARKALERDALTSIRIACSLVADGYADAVISAGHPGATVLAAKDTLGLREGITRAALAAVYPIPRRYGQEDPFGLLLDIGASAHATSEDLVCFAQMGAEYARIVSGRQAPRIALLSNSREATSAPPEVAEAHARLLVREDLNYVGTIEGHELLRARVDVIVCEGFVGDVTVKVLEGAGEAAWEMARAAYQSKFAYRQGLRLLSSGLEKVRRYIDFEEYGGAPLLGLEGPVILADPRSGAKALRNAVRLAIKNLNA